MKEILVTGGLGYIGSHTVVELINAGYSPVIVDNLSNSKPEVVNRIEKITGKKPVFYEVDVRDEVTLDEIFKAHKIYAVIHFAGLKAVGESVAKPLMYYENNLESTISLLKVMNKYGVKNLIFSSSATVYGDPEEIPLLETTKLNKTSNPYGETKAMIERILSDVYNTDKSMNIALLRYFNPIGAHESGLIGEDPRGIPNNLMPYITQVACGKRECLSVFGDDYNTPDGTGVRDYIHVVDLAIGHLKTLQSFENNPGLVIYNLGTGKGTSVLELVHAFEEANNIKIAYKIVPRRPGDLDVTYANVDKARECIGFVATKTMRDACRDSWNWQKNNPNGYDK